MRFLDIPRFCLIAGWLGAFALQAETVVWDLPVAPDTKVPASLAGLPVVVANGDPTVRLAFNAQSAPQSVAVTFYFKETEGVALRVLWEGDQSAVLCENLSEGTGLATQRTLLIPAWRFQQPGTLVVRSTGTELNVNRIRLAWLKVAPVLTAAKSAVPSVIQENGWSLTEREILATAYPSLEDSASGLVLRAPLLSEPMVLTNGVIFPLTLQAVPSLTKLDFLVSGIPLGAHLEARVKDVDLGRVAVMVPDLEDPGYFQDKDQWTYQGWRKASILVPVSALASGENELYVVAVDVNGQEITAPWALKEAVLQMRYAAYAPAKQSPDSDVQP